MLDKVIPIPGGAASLISRAEEIRAGTRTSPYPRRLLFSALTGSPPGHASMDLSRSSMATRYRDMLGKADRQSVV